MMHHNPPIMNEDETAVPVGTANLQPTTMTVGTVGRRSSKKVTKTTGRSFGRILARVGVGLLLLLLVAEGATVLPEEGEKGALWLDRGSFSPADRAATAAAEEDGVVVTEDGHDGAEAVVTPRRGTNKNSKKTTNPLVAVLVPEPALVPEAVPVPVVPLLVQGGYPYVTITNKTPFGVVSAGVRERKNSSVSYLGETLPYGCRPDYMYDGLGAGETWTAPSRGLCLVKTIRATLWYYHEESGWLERFACDPYISSGTAYSKYSILMKGDEHACCIRSSHESKRCEGDYLPARHPYSSNP